MELLFMIFDELEENSSFILLTCLLIPSIFLPIHYWWTYESPPEIANANLAYEMICNVCYGYIASYLFHIANVVYPKQQKKREAYDTIAVHLAKCHYNMLMFNIAFNIRNVIDWDTLKDIKFTSNYSHLTNSYIWHSYFIIVKNQREFAIQLIQSFYLIITTILFHASYLSSSEQYPLQVLLDSIPHKYRQGSQKELFYLTSTTSDTELLTDLKNVLSHWIHLTTDSSFPQKLIWLAKTKDYFIRSEVRKILSMIHDQNEKDFSTPE